jgi:hypothetical protein
MSNIYTYARAILVLVEIVSLLNLLFDILLNSILAKILPTHNITITIFIKGIIVPLEFIL